MTYAIRLYDEDDGLLCRLYKSYPSLEEAEELVGRCFPQFTLEVSPEKTTHWYVD